MNESAESSTLRGEINVKKIVCNIKIFGIRKERKKKNKINARKIAVNVRYCNLGFGCCYKVENKSKMNEVKAQ